MKSHEEQRKQLDERLTHRTRLEPQVDENLVERPNSTEDLVKKVRWYADEPAYPSLAQDPWGKGYMAGGLTKRELFAAMAMQGLLAALGDDLTRAAASDATSYADALIAALSAGEKA